MDHRFPGFLRRLSIILFWIILWQTAASLIRNHIFLVGPADTLRALCEQILLPDFWSAIAFSFWRISIGFFLAFFLGLFTGSLAASAQNLMNSYNQMAANVAAMEKNVEAAQSSYDAAVKKRSAGLIKDTELESEKSSLERQQNSLASLKEQQSELKESLLTLLGLSGRTDVEIGTVPDPDMAAIRAVSVENDLQTAISNDPTWVSEMKSKVTGTDNRELRKQRISEASQNAEISLRSTYENLQNAVSQYEAAESAYSAAKQAWDTVQKKQAAGMLSKNAYLSGESAWLSGEAAMNTAKLNLVAAYESYVWQVAGVETGASAGASGGGGAPAGR